MITEKQMTNTDQLHEERVELDEAQDHGVPVAAQTNELAPLVTVGQVKVESGGRAIVGNVDARPPAEQCAQHPGETVATVLKSR
jgi:hypothetical protein